MHFKFMVPCLRMSFKTFCISRRALKSREPKPRMVYTYVISSSVSVVVRITIRCLSMNSKAVTRCTWDSDRMRSAMEISVTENSTLTSGLSVNISMLSNAYEAPSFGFRFMAHSIRRWNWNIPCSMYSTREYSASECAERKKEVNFKLCWSSNFAGVIEEHIYINDKPQILDIFSLPQWEFAQV